MATTIQPSNPWTAMGASNSINTSVVNNGDSTFTATATEQDPVTHEAVVFSVTANNADQARSIATMQASYLAQHGTLTLPTNEPAGVVSMTGEVANENAGSGTATANAAGERFSNGSVVSVAVSSSTLRMTATSTPLRDTLNNANSGVAAGLIRQVTTPSSQVGGGSTIHATGGWSAIGAANSMNTEVVNNRDSTFTATVTEQDPTTHEAVVFSVTATNANQARSIATMEASYLARNGTLTLPMNEPAGVVSMTGEVATRNTSTGTATANAAGERFSNGRIVSQTVSSATVQLSATSTPLRDALNQANSRVAANLVSQVSSPSISQSSPTQQQRVMQAVVDFITSLLKALGLAK